MADVTISTSKIEAAHELKNANLPSKIYKFRGVNDYAIDNFKNDAVWVCSASSYNDPYDCASTFSTRELLNLQMLSTFDKLVEQVNLRRFLTDDELRQVRDSPDPLEELLDLMLPKDSKIPADSYGEIKIALFAALNKVHENYLKKHFALMQSGTKVCSFSARLDSVVMWGHYAANQTGFCLEYDVNAWSSDSILRRMLFPVIYSEQLFDITKYLRQSMLHADFNNLFAIIGGMYKALDWAYEEEWRFILAMGEGFEDRNISISKPCAIYLGSKISTDDQERLSRIARDKDISIFKMQLSPRKFQLEAYPP